MYLGKLKDIFEIKIFFERKDFSEQKIFPMYLGDMKVDKENILDFFGVKP